MVRHLGRLPHTAEPWLPLATLGPLLIVGHYDPASSDTWGLPSFLIIRTRLSLSGIEQTPARKVKGPICNCGKLVSICRNEHNRGTLLRNFANLAKDKR